MQWIGLPTPSWAMVSSINYNLLLRAILTAVFVTIIVINTIMVIMITRIINIMVITTQLDITAAI